MIEKRYEVPAIEIIKLDTEKDVITWSVVPEENMQSDSYDSW